MAGSVWGKGVRVDGREFPKPADRRACVWLSCWRLARSRSATATALRLSTPGPWSIGAAGLAGGHLLFVAIDVAGDGGIRNAVMDASSVYKLRKDVGPTARRSPGAPRTHRARDRRPVGRGLLQRDGHDLARRRDRPRRWAPQPVGTRPSSTASMRRRWRETCSRKHASHSSGSRGRGAIGKT